jgi:hypothetical protein
MENCPTAGGFRHGNYPSGRFTDYRLMSYLERISKLFHLRWLRTGIDKLDLAAYRLEILRTNAWRIAPPQVADTNDESFVS